MRPYNRPALAAAAALTLLTAVPAHAQLRTWVDGDSVWSDPANWSPNDVPDTPAETAEITNGSSVDLDGTFAVGGLTLGGSDSLTLLNSRDLALSGDVTNDGTITLDAGFSTTEFRVDASLTLGGTGELVIAPGGFTTTNVIGDDGAAGNALTNAAGHTIRAAGQGSLGRNTTTLVNAGAIVADDGGLLIVNPGAGGFTLASTGTITANTGGQIDLVDGTYDLQGGTIGGTGLVRFAGNASLDGGTFNGSVETVGLNSATDLTNNGTITVNNGSDLSVGGTITNDGTITLDAGFSTTEFRTDADTTLAGTGTLVIGPDGFTTTNVIGDDGAAGNTFTNGAGHTIRADGDGGLGRNTTAIVNDGDVIANGATLRIDPFAGGFTQNATGSLTADNGGRIELADGDFTFNGGSVSGTNGGTVVLAGDVDLDGGSFQGTVESLGFNTITDATNAGDITVNNGSDLGVVGTVTNDGTITLDAGFSTTELRIDADATLAGSGKVIIGPNGFQTTAVIGDDGAAGNTLTIGSDQTIEAQGAGGLGRDTTAIVNNGTVTSVAGGDLLIDPSAGGFTNSGTLAADEGVITLTNGTFTNTGAIRGTGGGVVELAGNAVLTGNGTVTGDVTAVGFNTLDDVATQADLTITNGSDLSVNGTITNDGTITLDAGFSTTELRVDSDTTLAGSGEVVTAATGFTTTALIGDDGASGNTLTVGPDQTIRALGQANLGRNTTALVNDGTVASDGGDLTIDPSMGGFANNGTVRAVNGGIVTLTGGDFTNVGTIEAVDSLPGDRSAVTISTSANLTNLDVASATLTGGTYRARNGSLFLAPPGLTFDLAVNDATLILSGDAAATTLFNSAAIGSTNSQAFTENRGTLVLDDTFRLQTDGGADGVLDNLGEIHLTDGGRLVFAGGATLDNAGTLAGTGTVQANDVTSDGTISPGDEADEAGTLNFLGSLTLESAGTLLIDLLAPDLADVLDVGNVLTLAGTLDVDVAGTAGLTDGDLILIADANVLSGSFGAIVDDDARFDFTTERDGGRLFLRANAIPEPASLAALGLAGLALRRRRA